MDRKTAASVLRAYSGIDRDIKSKMLFAQESGDRSRYEREADDLRQVKRDIIAALNELPHLERNCLWDHYIKGELWVRISQKYAYSERQIRNIAGSGLDRLVKAFDKRPSVVKFISKTEG